MLEAGGRNLGKFQIWGGGNEKLKRGSRDVDDVHFKCGMHEDAHMPKNSVTVVGMLAVIAVAVAVVVAVIVIVVVRFAP